MIRRYVLIATVILAGTLPWVDSQLAAAEEWHTAQEGDTLQYIADQHEVPVAELAAWNELDPSAAVSSGQVLLVPEPVGSTAQSYIVAPGDTVASIATTFGVSAKEIRAANSIDDVQDLRIGTELVIPGSTSTEPEVASVSSGSVIDGVFAYQQSRSLSCEYASVYIATSVFGDPIYEEEYIDSMPSSANPHYGFRGSIDGPWGITEDYGIYAEALVPLLEARGYRGDVSYDPRAEVLQQQLAAGVPVVVWIATRGDTGFYETDGTGSYKLVPFEHVVVAYGYDSGGVYVSDPGQGVLTYYSWEWFLPAWSVMDGMALAVHPA